MPWDDFERVGSPAPPQARIRGLTFGRELFSPALQTAFSRAGLRAQEIAGLEALDSVPGAPRPDFLICSAALVGPDPEAFMERLADNRAAGSCPCFLVCEQRLAPESAASTAYSEMLGSGQDALGYFLMIRATLRRKRAHVMTDVLAFGNLALDQEKFALSFEDTVVPLNLLEFCVLGAMLDAPHMVWNKVYLNRVVFGPVDLKPGRQFDTYMSRVRRGVREKIGIDPIIAQHGLGYALQPSILGAESIARREGA